MCGVNAMHNSSICLYLHGGNARSCIGGHCTVMSQCVLLSLLSHAPFLLADNGLHSVQKQHHFHWWLVAASTHQGWEHADVAALQQQSQGLTVDHTQAAPQQAHRRFAGPMPSTEHQSFLLSAVHVLLRPWWAVCQMVGRSRRRVHGAAAHG